MLNYPSKVETKFVWCSFGLFITIPPEDKLMVGLSVKHIILISDAKNYVLNSNKK